MPKVIADITMSLDGYVTGPGADREHGLGDAPELHAWVFEKDAVDIEILEGSRAATGAVVMGRRLFDTVDGPHGWSKHMGYGADQVGSPPFVVVTHSPPHDVRLVRRWRRHRTGARGGPRRRVSRAPRAVGAWRRHSVVPAGYASAVLPTRGSPVTQRRPHRVRAIARRVGRARSAWPSPRALA